MCADYADTVKCTAKPYNLFYPELSKNNLFIFAKLQQAAVRFVVSIHLSAWNNSAPTGRIMMKFDICVFSIMCREI